MPNFIYTNNIPAASHNPSADQPIMQVNTNSINSIIGIDHYSFNDPNNLSGYHKVIDLVNQTVIPTLPSGVGAMIYAGQGELIFNNANIPTGTFLTQSKAPPVAAARGSSFLPGLTVMQWGSGAITSGVFNDSYIYPMTTTFGIFSGVKGATGGIITNASFLSTTIVTVVAKLANGSFAPDGTIVYWMAIGVL
jgi:hypothetical protein